MVTHHSVVSELSNEGEFKMVKLFRKADQTFTPNDSGGAVLGLINSGFSDALGAGIGTFEDCANEWTVTYDEVLFVLDGVLTIRVGDDAYNVGPGDVIWIPKDTALVYEAGAKTTFFYAVCPVDKSPSTSKQIAYPTAAPS